MSIKRSSLGRMPAQSDKLGFTQCKTNVKRGLSTQSIKTTFKLFRTAVKYTMH